MKKYLIIIALLVSACANRVDERLNNLKTNVAELNNSIKDNQSKISEIKGIAKSCNNKELDEKILLLEESNNKLQNDSEMIRILTTELQGEYRLQYEKLSSKVARLNIKIWLYRLLVLMIITWLYYKFKLRNFVR